MPKTIDPYIESQAITPDLAEALASGQTEEEAADFVEDWFNNNATEAAEVICDAHAGTVPTQVVKAAAFDRLMELIGQDWEARR